MGMRMGMERFPQQVVRFVGSVPRAEAARGLPLAFVHINKTAGTTFTQYLRDHFVQRDSIAPPFYGSFDDIGIHDPSRELFWGHFSYAQFSQQRRPAWFITFVREPVQRVISQYRSLHNPANLRADWQRVLPAEARRAMEFAQRASFEEFVCSNDPFILGHIQDLQTLFLSSVRNRENAEFLSSALSNLKQRFLFVGTTERFDESIDLFRYQLSSPHAYTPATHQCNVSQRYPVEMNGRALDRVMELVRNDLILYQYAADLVDVRLEVLQRSNEDRGMSRRAA